MTVPDYSKANGIKELPTANNFDFPVLERYLFWPTRTPRPVSRTITKTYHEAANNCAYDPSLVPSTASMDTSKPLAPSFISHTSSKRAVSFDAELYFHLTARWPPFPLMDATPHTTHRPMGDLLNALQDDIERYTAKIAYDKARVVESRKEIEEMLVALPELDDNITQLMRQMPPYDAVTRDQIDRFSKRRASMQDMLREVPSLTEEQLHLDLTPRFYSLQERYEKKKVIHDMGILIWDSLVFATLFFMITLILMAFFFFRPSD